METAFRSDERFTQSEFFDWLQQRPCADINHYELLGGRIVMTPPAGYLHASVGAQICAALVQHVNAGDLGEVYDASAGFELPSGDTVQPDVSFVSRAKLEDLPAPDDVEFHRVVPDLVVEILSRATARRDRTEKKRIYEKNGVAEYWIVSQQPREIIVHRLVDGRYEKPVHVVSGSVQSSILPGLAVAVSSIFRSR